MRWALPLASLVLCAAGCGSAAPHLDPVRVELAIQAAIHQQRGLSAGVRCPRALVRAGETFTCLATTRPGGHVTVFEVTETDARGHVHFLGLR